MDKRATYKEPVISHSNYSKSATWRIVWYEMIAPGQWKRARPTGDLNRISDNGDRLIAAKILCKMISEALSKGWRYFQMQKIKEYASENLVECLTSQTKSKAASLSTVKSGQSFTSWTKIFIEFLREKRLAHLNIAQLTPLHIQLFIDQQIEKKKSNTTINNIIRGVSNVFGRIVRLYGLPGNPFKEVDKLKETESTKFEVYTDAELSRINNHLKKVSPELRLFFLHIYYAYMRPASITRLQVKHYDFDLAEITVNPEDHKNRKANKKQLLKPHMEALIEAGIPALDKDTYVFSSTMKPGKHLRTARMATKLWHLHIIRGLGINKKLYAAKHTGATNFLLDNSGKENISWFQNQMGHSNLAESKAYIDKKKKVTLDETSSVIREL